MHEFVRLNHQILPVTKTFLSAISSATFYGKGVFTTIAIYDSKPFLWEKHWQRLTENAQKLGVDLLGFNKNSVKNSLLEIIEINNFTNGRARITFFDESPGKIWSFETAGKTSLLITTADFQTRQENLQLTFSPFPVNSKSPLVNVKSCNYLENILAFEEAKKRRFDEAVRLNEREEIVSACLANLFWVKGNEIFTPGLETGCLGGTTRAFFLENFSIKEKRVNKVDLIESDEVFLASSGIGIAAVKSIEGKIFTNSSTIFTTLQTSLSSHRSAAT